MRDGCDTQEGIYSWILPSLNSIESFDSSRSVSSLAASSASPPTPSSALARKRLNLMIVGHYCWNLSANGSGGGYRFGLREAADACQCPSPASTVNLVLSLGIAGTRGTI
ncbi:hypothetical protein M378DRAFT_173258 [Amanita muscaria Koide BX008]|uniref:Uncharacterized protein n=1 Tax=Amanita muscaria (strain Koide BX008) TaxID=946122 RepID=A0A0C2SPB0_AMAMK|nr:hypothetical protein M378DRAFT_173258 [Amanita muscaria Koide BX008]